MKRKLLRKPGSYQFSFNTWNRMFAAILILASGLAILLVPFGLISLFFSLRPYDRFLSDIVTINASALTDQSDMEPVTVGKCSNCAILKLEVQRFILDERRLEGVIVIEIPTEVVKKLWGDKEEYIVTSDEESPGALTLKARYEDLEVRLLFPSARLANSTSDQILVPLKYFFAENTTGKVSLPIEIKVSGEPNLYPGDWYTVSSNISLVPPDSIWLLDTEASSFRGIIPAELFVSSNFQMKGYDLILKQGKSSLGYSLPLELLIVRDTVTRYYSYSMAFLPIVLSIIFAHALFVNQRTKEKAYDNLIFEVSAVMLAVLPLRSVLVPSNFQGLVRIDMILGLGIVLIVSVATLKYGLETWKLSNS